jgi:ABC-type cobalamin/Fe3+-siderophores transport system ATPase subunit
VRLLKCLDAFQKGHIRIDGQDVARGSRTSLRSAIALVPQDPILLPDRRISVTGSRMPTCRRFAGPPKWPTSGPSSWGRIVEAGTHADLT